MKHMRNRRTNGVRLRAVLAAIFAAAALSGTAAYAQDAIVPDNFATISAAVVGATDMNGDGIVEIFVRAGTYLENVLIQRSNLLLVGEDPRSTVIRGAGALDTVRAENSSNVTIRSFKVTGDGIGDGIEFSDMVDSTILENFVIGNRDVITVNRSNGCTVRRNLSQANIREGIKLNLGGNNMVTRNVVRNNTEDGILSDRSNGNTFSMNRVLNNLRIGIGVGRSSGNLVDGNTVRGHLDAGIRVRTVDQTVISGNTSSQNQNGLRTEQSSNSLITMNAFTNNTEWGVRRKDWVNDDYDGTLGGIQDPPGDNDLSGNTLGPLRED